VPGEAPVLTYKGPKLPGDGPKSREEICIAVVEGELLEQVLDRLGFRRTAQVVKERDLYLLEGATIALDRVETLGTFIEIEAKIRVRALEPVRARLRELKAEHLGMRVERDVYYNAPTGISQSPTKPSGSGTRNGLRCLEWLRCPGNPRYLERLRCPERPRSSPTRGPSSPGTGPSHGRRSVSRCRRGNCWNRYLTGWGSGVPPRW